MKAAILPLIDPAARLGIASLALASAIGGLIEAGALVLISTAAIAISSGDTTVSVLGRTLTTNHALIGAAILLAIRLGFSILASRLTAVISSRSYLRLTRRLVSSYLHTNAWRAGLPENVVLYRYFVIPSWSWCWL